MFWKNFQEKEHRKNFNDSTKKVSTKKNSIIKASAYVNCHINISTTTTPVLTH